ncbi:MAG: hypothetical protein GWP91_22210 [Rhodobacterales bacterium]|nr:hypothetical protein [Rhodobacterales bacterium]
MFNLTVVVGGGFGVLTDLDDGPDIEHSNPLSLLRPELGYDFTLTDRSRIVTTIRSNVMNLIAGSATGTVGAYWCYGHKQIGGSLGVNVSAVAVGNDLQVALDEAGVNFPSVLVAPLPQAQIWFRL